MVALLKQKSKVTIQQKPRKSYEAKDIFKKRKLDESELQNVTIRQQQHSDSQSSLQQDYKKK